MNPSGGSWKSSSSPTLLSINYTLTWSSWSLHNYFEMFWSYIYILSSNTVCENRVQRMSCVEELRFWNALWHFRKKPVKNWCIGLQGVYPLSWQMCSLGDSTLQFAGGDQCGCFLRPPRMTCGQNEYRRRHRSPWYKAVCPLCVFLEEGCREAEGTRRNDSHGALVFCCAAHEQCLLPHWVFLYCVTAEWLFH